MKMTAEQVPSFVEDVITAGCVIWAVGDDMYVFGDTDLSRQDYEAVRPLLATIEARYGERSHLRREIVQHLRLIGRHTEIDAPRSEFEAITAIRH